MADPVTQAHGSGPAGANSPPLTVVVAIQDELPRLGVKAALEMSETARVAAVLDAPDRLDAVLAEHAPAVLILDVRFRIADPELLPMLARRHPTCRVLMYVAHTARQCALRHLLRAGGRAQLSPDALRRIDECCLTSLRGQARGCLASEASAAEVVQTVNAVGAGQVAATPWLSAFAGMGSGNGVGQPPITPRELEVMALLANGLSNKAIAQDLGIRERTVKNHAARLMAKLELSSRAQVGAVAARYNVRVTDAGTDA